MDDRFETFAHTIAQLNRAIQKIKSLEMNEVGLKGTHTMCLYYLGKHPEGLTSAELSLLCHEDKAAVSRSIATLESHHLIESSSGSGKREYRAKLFLTDKGKEIADFIRNKIREFLAIGGAGLTDEDREQFYSYLRLIAGNLKRYLDAEEGEKHT
ncbi:MAG: MarR family winged helix-turn-helix transcriptional regulator [Lachnospiraceae bacterium]